MGNLSQMTDDELAIIKSQALKELTLLAATEEMLRATIAAVWAEERARWERCKKMAA